MNVAVIGSGGREHALCHALHQSSLLTTLYAIPGNPGMANIATCVSIDPSDFAQLTSFCQEHHIELVIPGSEVYLEQGITNHLEAHGIKVFGPTKEAARIESSKQFAKDMMARHHIPTASFHVFSDYQQAFDHLHQHGVPIVIKYDGLAGGKGVVVALTMEVAEQALHDMLQERMYGDDPVVLEEYLEGPEFSLMCFVHNNIVIPMPIAQDHKRLLDGDQGPNTGGMGIYSPVPIIAKDIVQSAMDTIMIPMANALLQEHLPYTGFLYGGLMATKEGPKVIEFNARFGDPEAEVILPKLKTDLLSVILSLLQEKTPSLSWSNDIIVGVVMASKGYPGSYQSGVPIHHVNDTSDLVFHMGTAQVKDQLITKGGRVLLVIGRGKTITEAVQHAYQNVKTIRCDNLIYRTDIAHQSL